MDSFSRLRKPIIGLIFVISILALNANAEEQKEACGEKQLGMAFIMMQAEVTRRLKSPSSAKFPWNYSKGSRLLGDCVFRVKAYVDATNSFGAKIRTSFSGTIRYFPSNGSWQVKTLKVGN